MICGCIRVYMYMYTHTFLIQLRAKVWLKVNYYGCVLEELKKIKPSVSESGHRK